MPAFVRHEKKLKDLNTVGLGKGRVPLCSRQMFSESETRGGGAQGQHFCEMYFRAGSRVTSLWVLLRYSLGGGVHTVAV